MGAAYQPTYVWSAEEEGDDRSLRAAGRTLEHTITSIYLRVPAAVAVSRPRRKYTGSLGYTTRMLGASSAHDVDWIAGIGAGQGCLELHTLSHRAK